MGRILDKIQVLIIEDDKSTAEFFKTIMVLAGFECELTLTSRAALARLSAHVPDLVILDLCLGGEIGGEDILYQIRSNPRLERTRVIVVTAYSENARAVDYLADLILLKPIDMHQLTTLARRLLSMQISPKRALFRDPVTDLFNQDFFMTRLELAIERRKRRREFYFSVLIVRLQITDTMLEVPGIDNDVFLQKEVARRLRSNLRPTDTIARFSDGSFVILNEDMNSPEDSAIIIDRLNQVLSRPYQLDEVWHEFSFEIQATDCLPGYETPAEIIKALQ